MPEFKNLRKKVQRRRIETLLLAAYAVAVTCALVISLFNKNVETKPQETDAADNYDFSSDVLTPAFVDSVTNNPFEQAYTDVYSINLISENPQLIQKFVLVQNNKHEIIMPGTPRPKKRTQYGSMDGIYQKERHVVMVEKGDTFIGMLNRLGMDSKNATEAYNVLRKVYDTRHLKVGQYFVLTGVFNLQSHDLEMLDTLIIEPERGTRYILHTNEYDKYEVKVEQEKFARDTKVISGQINGSVVNSLADAGVPARFRGEIINIFSHALNFSRDIRKGDSFEVKYEVSKDSYGDVVKVGNLLYAAFKNNNRNYKMYRYQNQFYNDKGETKKTGLDKKPLAARNARISSLFGYRRHPILKTQKFHSGVDYAAPRGTAVYASGNGRVEMARYVNGYGNFIKIRHSSEYETAYGHLQRFASGIRPGVSVRKGQIIAYVGNTGRSTGPHLHFEILRHGQRINPLKAAIATGNDLTGGQLVDFKRTMRNIDGLKETIARSKPQHLVESIKKEPPSLKMTIAQTPLLIQEAQKNLPLEQQLFRDEDIKQIGQNLEQIENTEHQNTKVAKETNATKKEDNTEEVPHEMKEQKVDNRKQNNESPALQLKEETQELTANESEYKGSVVYPPKISSSKARDTYLIRQLSAQHKLVKPGPKRPSYAGKRASRR